MYILDPPLLVALTSVDGEHYKYDDDLYCDQD